MAPQPVEAQSAGSWTAATNIAAPPKAKPSPRREPAPEPQGDAEPIIAAQSASPLSSAAPEEIVGRDPMQGPETDPEAAISNADGKSDPALLQDPALQGLRDDRPDDEVRALTGAPAGYDPVLFTIEPEPFNDRRIAQFYRFEPFEAKGIRRGSFVVLPEVEFGVSHDTNVFKAQPSRADVAFDLKPTVRIVSDWRIHAVEFTAKGVVSDYTQTPDLNDRNAKLEARGRLDISRRANLEALISRELSQDSPSALDSQLSGSSAQAQRAEITQDTVAATYNQRFNRLSLQLRGSAIEQTFSGAQNLDRNVATREGAARLSYEFKPALGVFVDGSINAREHATAAFTDGISRNSRGERARAGLSFGTSGAYLRGDISVGYGTQRPGDLRLAAVSGVLVDANLAFKPFKSTTFLLSASTDVAETTLSGSSGALSRVWGLEARQEITRRWIATAGLSETYQTYAGATLVEREWDGKLGFDYFVSQDVTLLGTYTHAIFLSNDLSRNYIDDAVRIAVRVRQ